MIDFEKDGKKFQITFSFPDKRNTFRRYTFSKLSCKIENPENPEDFAWETWGESYSKCNLWLDIYNKEVGRYYAFKNLIDKWYDKEFRAKLWKLYFDKYGIPPKIKSVNHYFPYNYYLAIKATDKNKKINDKIKSLINIKE